jgi:hypothetical protein
VGIKKICLGCGKVFEGRTNSRYCSLKCRKEAYKKHNQKSSQKWLERTNNTKLRDPIYSCDWCGQDFEITPGNYNQRYCSEPCRIEASKENGRRAYAEFIKRYGFKNKLGNSNIPKIPYISKDGEDPVPDWDRYADIIKKEKDRIISKPLNNEQLKPQIEDEYC